MMILPVNTSTVLLTCKILQIYFDKLKLTSHNCYDGLLNTAEASSVHCDGRKTTEVLLPQVCMPDTALEREGCHREGREERHQTTEGYSALHTIPLRTDKNPGKVRSSSVVM